MHGIFYTLMDNKSRHWPVIEKITRNPQTGNDNNLYSAYFVPNNLRKFYEIMSFCNKKYFEGFGFVNFWMIEWKI